MQTSLLAFHGTGVTGQEASFLQGWAICRVVNVEGPGDSQSESACLAGGAATGEIGVDVELAVTVDEHQGCLDELLVQLVGEVFFQGTTVADELAGAFYHAHPDDGALPAANGLDGAFMVGGQFCLNLGFCVDKLTATTALHTPMRAESGW